MMKPRLYQVEEGWIETYTGRQFHFKDPRAEEVDIEDIAHSLSMLCRYNGHVSDFYSVAEHSVLISDFIRAEGGDRDLALAALLHDAAETYIGDISRPVKYAVLPPEFKEYENELDRVIFEKFGLTFPYSTHINDLDARILQDERMQGMSQSENLWGTDDLEPLGLTLRFWGPAKAKAKFLQRFEMLHGR